MRILVVAATEEEVGGLKSEFGISMSDLEGKDATNHLPAANNCQLLTANCNLLITGVGMVATAFELGRHLAKNQYDFALNLGIAGCFDRNIALGDVCETVEDTFSELGAEDYNEFLPIDKMGFGNGTFYPVPLPEAYNHRDAYKLTRVTAITVNTVHGSDSSIKKITGRLNPQLESMEGAAFFYACKEYNLSCLQIRAVSNYVEKRNRDSWKIGLAIKNLNTFAVEFLKLYA